MVVRACKIEVILPAERKPALRELAVECQRMTNRLWQTWLCHHVVAGSAKKLRDHFDAFAKWQETKEGTKPAWPCKAHEPPLTTSSDPGSYYRILVAEFGNVTSRTRGLLTNAWQSKVTTRKSSSGSLPGWVAILFGLESLPSFHKPLPIPFDKQCGRLVKQGGKYICEMRMQRDDATGDSTIDRGELMLGKRKALSQRRIVDRVIDGEYAWRGCNLLFDRGKWFAVICYEMPVKTQQRAMDPDKVLYVRPGRSGPWRVRIDGGQSFAFGGDGKHVIYARRAIIDERNSRKTHYRWAGSAQKGRGTQRADAVWVKLSSRYKDFVKRYNHEVSRRLVNFAASRGIGRIVYLQPTGQHRDSRFLSTAGNDDRSGMFWDYFQFGSLLSSKCEAEGIEYGAKPKEKKQAQRKAKPNSMPRVRKDLRTVS